MELIKKGKSKFVYATENPEEIVIQFIDQALACNGLKRGRIEGKGKVNAAVTSTIYTMLEQNNIATHYIKTLDETSILVKKLDIIPILIKVRNRAAGNFAQRLSIPLGTKFSRPIVELCLHDSVLHNPIINKSHVLAFEWATEEEIDFMIAQALKINTLLQGFLNKEKISLVDFTVEFGKHHNQILLADDISTDNTRLWDAETDESMDMDRFRWGLGDIEEQYRELVERLVK
ncbi:MAG: phosphoribosylaminoimidazolesuccinocarboxamide synthase [Eubacteriales bacterium]|nr:phosphoribosylaminoimidazolesuccinocarboxamide synthase [Eubacteriales bacterium]